MLTKYCLRRPLLTENFQLGHYLTWALSGLHPSGNFFFNLDIVWLGHCLDYTPLAKFFSIWTLSDLDFVWLDIVQELGYCPHQGNADNCLRVTETTWTIVGVTQTQTMSKLDNIQDVQVSLTQTMSKLDNIQVLWVTLTQTMSKSDNIQVLWVTLTWTMSNLSKLP